MSTESQDKTSKIIKTKKALSKNAKLKVMGLSLVGIFLVLGSGVYYQYTKRYPSSDDAYLNANIVQMATQVNGQVSEINIQNYKYVTQGQMIFKLDPRAYEYARDQAAVLILLDQSKVNVLSDALKVSEANLQKAQADLFIAEGNNQRVSTLLKNHQASEQDGDQAMGAYLSAKAQVSAMSSAYLEAQQDLEVAKHQVEIAQSDLKTAELNLSYTQIKAPTSGYVSQFALRPGSLVSAGDNLFELVDDQDWWVDANYKETQLARIRPEQAAKIRMDMYPDHVFKGKVLEISPNSGSSFSLLPPENATGNWVKVVQRYPVKVELLMTQEEKKLYPPRVGASTTVTVDTDTTDS
jgi:membrane fusion protein (multidrug efflux system)